MRTSCLRCGSPRLMLPRLGHFPDLSGTGVRVDDTRGDGAQVGDAQVVIADEVELVLMAGVSPVTPESSPGADGPPGRDGFRVTE